MSDPTHNGEVHTAESDAATRSPEPGTVAVVSMMRSRAAVALFDGMFWRSVDSRGPVKCVPAAITSIETPYVYSPERSVIWEDHERDMQDPEYRAAFEEATRVIPPGSGDSHE